MKPAWHEINICAPWDAGAGMPGDVYCSTCKAWKQNGASMVRIGDRMEWLPDCCDEWAIQQIAWLESLAEKPRCPKCYGSGFIGETGAIQGRTTCPICRGTGKAQPLGENEVYAIVKGVQK